MALASNNDPLVYRIFYLERETKRLTKLTDFTQKFNRSCIAVCILLLVWMSFPGSLTNPCPDLAPHPTLSAAPTSSIEPAKWHWRQLVHDTAGISELYKSNWAISQFYYSQEALSAAMARMHATAVKMQLQPQQVQQLADIASDTSAYLAAQAARIAEAVSLRPAPKPRACSLGASSCKMCRPRWQLQQHAPANTTVSHQQLAYHTHAGTAWQYKLELVQPALAQLTATYTAQVQQVVSAAQQKGLPSSDAAQISAQAAAAAQTLLERSSSILQPQQPQEPQPTTQQQQPQQQEGWKWVQLAYAASGRSAVYDTMLLQQHVSAAMVTATELGVSPAAMSQAAPVLASAVMNIVAGITSAATAGICQQQQQQQQEVEVELMVADLTAIATVNASTQPTATNSTPEAHQSQLPPLALLPLCSTANAAAAQCAACDCSCDSAAQQVLEDLMAEDAAVLKLQEMASTVSKGLRAAAMAVKSTLEAAPAAARQVRKGATVMVNNAGHVTLSGLNKWHSILVEASLDVTRLLKKPETSLNTTTTTMVRAQLC